VSIPFGKKLTLTTYCLTRQGERSIDFALSSTRQWLLLREYYGAGKLKLLQDLLQSLKSLHPRHGPYRDKDRFARITFGWVATYPLRWWINQWRDCWMFTTDEVSFFIDAIARLVSCLTCAEKPPSGLLVDLRIDLHLCQRIIEMKLVGFSLLKRASHIDHFCQADHVASASLNQILGLITDQQALTPAAPSCQTPPGTP
jgi:hypothetical protein